MRQVKRKLVEAATQVATRPELDKILSDAPPIGVNNYDALENTCLYKPRKSVVGDVWIWVEEDDTFYRQWPRQHMSMSSTGKTAYWSPYVTSKDVKPIRLLRAAGLGKNAWMLR